MTGTGLVAVTLAILSFGFTGTIHTVVVWLAIGICLIVVIKGG